MDKYVKVGALEQAALEALIAGAGVAFFFALGLRGLAMWSGDDVSATASSGVAPTTAGARNPAGLVLAVLCFAAVVAIVGVGLFVMLASK
jgi:hypothetical protein